MDFDRIITSTPVNSTAARQTGPGEAWEPRVTLQDYYTQMPRLVKVSAKMRQDPGFTDFTGQAFGRLTVLGLMEKDVPQGAPSSWVCRCKCGYFCTRKTKSLKVAARGGNSFVPMCGRCKYQDKLRNGWTPNLKITVKV